MHYRLVETIHMVIAKFDVIDIITLSKASKIINQTFDMFS